MTWGKIHTEDPQMLGAAVQNLVARAPRICVPQTGVCGIL